MRYLTLMLRHLLHKNVFLATRLRNTFVELTESSKLWSSNLIKLSAFFEKWQKNMALSFKSKDAANFGKYFTLMDL